MGVFLQAIDKVCVGSVVGGYTRETHSHTVFLVEQYQLLAPVADDVAPEGSTLGIDRHISVVADFGELHFTPIKEILHINVVVAIARLDYLAVQFVVPPHTLARELVCVL